MASVHQGCRVKTCYVARAVASRLYVRSLSDRNRRPRTGSGGGPAKRYVRSSTTSTTSRRRSFCPRPKTDPQRSTVDAGVVPGHTSSCRLAGLWSTIERALGSQLWSARETPRPAELAEGRPSGQLSLSSRAVDVPAALQPTYVVSVVQLERVNAAGIAVTSSTCQRRRSPATMGFGTSSLT